MDRAEQNLKLCAECKEPIYGAQYGTPKGFICEKCQELQIKVSQCFK